MMKGWAETYDEAIDALLWVANDGYDQEDLIESIDHSYCWVRDHFNICMI